MTAPRPLDTPLKQRALGVLRQRAAGLVIDLDGTISPIVATPSEAFVAPAARRALASLARRLAIVAVVSGRRASEARATVGVGDLLYIGNHGFETWEGGRNRVHSGAEAFIPQIEAVLRELAIRLPLPGVVFENKGVTASVHYRNVTDHDQARQSILAAAAASPAASGLRLVEGRMVVELRPPMAVDKGTALSELVRERALRGVVYLGDDVTDKDAFDSLRRWRETAGIETLSICVGSSETPLEVASSADYVVAGVAAAEELLGWLAEALSDGG